MSIARLNQLQKSLAKAKYELQLLLSEMSDPIGEHDVNRLLAWIDDNRDATDHDPFSHFAEAIEKLSQDPSCAEFQECGDYGPLVSHFSSVFEDFNAIDLFALAHEICGVPFAWDTSFPFFDKCERQYDEILRRIPGCDPGYIYVLTNPSMPGLVKIGFTRRASDIRASELNTSGIPTPFVVAHEQMVRNCELTEALVHHRLSAFRVAANREFFRMQPDDAIEALIAIIREQQTNEAKKGS